MGFNLVLKEIIKFFLIKGNSKQDNQEVESHQDIKL